MEKKTAKKETLKDSLDIFNWRLSKRELFAALIMAGVTARDGLSTPEVELEKAQKSVAAADILISQLE